MRQRYPEPPRSAPQPTVTSSRAEGAYNSNKHTTGQTTQQAPVTNGTPQPSTVVNDMDSVQQQREEAKQFIRLLNANNIGYHALAKENIDVELLRGMYRGMNLPSEPEPIPPPKTNGTVAMKPSTESQATTTPSTSQRAVPSVSTNVAAAASAASAAASPVDRKDYLARLQAAKLARQSGPAKASPPQKSPPVTVASPATGISTPQAIMTPTKKPPVTDEQKARQTELIKQRLEALKAQSKQTAASSNNTAQKPELSQSTPQLPPTPGAGTSTPLTPATSFPGIPGLFMNAPTSSGSGTSTPLRQPKTLPQKRPAPSEAPVSTPRSSVTPYNRSFGQSPHAHQEDSMIIEVSDDESNGSDMDIDDDQAPSGPSAIEQAPVSIPGFPTRQAPVPAAASAVSTPGPQTPATLARTGELSTKEQELAALKLTLKKKLAEQKRIKEAAGAASAAASAAAASAAAPQETPSKQEQLQPGGRAQETVTPASAQSGTSAGDTSRDRKRRRRTEIQEQLPTLDDEIASNEAEMARLAKDLERLRANNERIMQDKQRLTKELEDLGIDTEGMSHADMRATKDEIERAMSPEVENVPHTASGLSQGLPSNKEYGTSATAPIDKVDTAATEPISLYAPAPVSSLPNPSQFGFLPGLGQAAPNVHATTASQPTPQPAKEQLANLSHNLQSPDLEKPIEASGPIAVVNDRASATPMDDDEDFYSPPPPVEVAANREATVAEAPEPQVEQKVTDAPSPSEEGEVEMSESSEEEDEEEYEPEEPIVEESIVETPTVEASAINEHISEPPSQQAQLPEPQVNQSQSLGQSQVSTEDEEAYEPPDVDKEMTEVVPVADEASSPGDADDGAMDIATSSSESSDDSDSESDEETRSESGELESQTYVVQQDTNIADDLAPELQPETLVAVVPAAEQTHNVSSL